MNRRHFFGAASVAAGTTLLAAFDPFNLFAGNAQSLDPSASPDWQPLELSDDRWKEVLSEQEYRILRDEATERAGTSPLNEEKRDGTFICGGCFLPLFASKDKFMSGTGWPSFSRPLKAENMATKRDFKLILRRTEYHCARCGGHQGQIFDDGPAPTGKRYCNNGAALDFVPAGEALPELRK